MLDLRAQVSHHRSELFPEGLNFTGLGFYLLFEGFELLIDGQQLILTVVFQCLDLPLQIIQRGAQRQSFILQTRQLRRQLRFSIGGIQQGSRQAAKAGVELAKLRCLIGVV